MHPSERKRDEPASIPVPGPRPALHPVRPAPRYQLPFVPSALLGRDHDLAAARELVLGNHTRLLTLVGPPGVGKTRLALAVAESLQEDFEQGAAFVDLSPLRNPELVGEAIARTFGLRQQGNLSPADQLETYLRDASLLLLLDNFEHLLDASPDIARLLAQAPGVVVLATSRIALTAALGAALCGHAAGYIRGRTALCRARPGLPPRFSPTPTETPQRREQRGRGRDLHPARWSATGDRARRGTLRGAHALRNPCPTRSATTPAYHRAG